MSTPHTGDLARRDQILDVAAQAFAKLGFSAAGMRDIARDAGCSLSLLVHHFGTKRAMLEAVVKQHDGFCQERLTGLRAQLQRADGISVDDFITTWAHYEFDLYATRSGRRYLTLMLRLQADREVDDDVRGTLNCAEVTVMKGFARAWPSMDEAALRGVWRMTSTALYAAITGDGDASAEGAPGAAAAQRRAIAFLLHGLHAYCNCPTDENS
jgi:AcrR family transcriptional regulator